MTENVTKESDLPGKESEPDKAEREWQTTLHNLYALGFYFPKTWFKIPPTNSAPAE